jgi:hypothetical protein
MSLTSPKGYGIALEKMPVELWTADSRYLLYNPLRQAV